MARRLGLVGLAGSVVGLAAEWVGFGWGDPRHWIPDLAVGWTFIGCGLIASARRPASRTGLLMAATGFTWFLGNFAQVGVAAVAWAAAHLVYLHRGPLVQLVLTYPSGRPGSRLVRGAVAVGYAAAVITPIWRNAGATILLATLLLGVCAREYVRAVGPPRRARLIVLQAGAGLSLVLAGIAAARLLLPREEVGGASLLVYELALLVLAGGLLAGAGRPVGAGGGHRPGRRARRGPLGHASRGAVQGARRPVPRHRLLAPRPGGVRRRRGPHALPARSRFAALGDHRGARGSTGCRPGPPPRRAGGPGAAGGGRLRHPARGLQRSAPGRGAGPRRGACSVAPTDPGGTG